MQDDESTEEEATLASKTFPEERNPEARRRKRTVAVNPSDDPRIRRLLAKMRPRWGAISFMAACRSLFRLLELLEEELERMPHRPIEALHDEPAKNDLDALVAHERAFVRFVVQLVSTAASKPEPLAQNIEKAPTS